MTDSPTQLPLKSQSRPVSTTGSAWSPFEALRTEVDRLFDDFVPSRWRTQSIFGRTGDPLSGWMISPAVDLVEKDDAYEVSAEFPGLDQEDVEVKLSNGVLTVSGEKHEEKEDRQTEYHLSERRYGSFQRSFRLFEDVDEEKISASFDKGVLTINVPKKPGAKKGERKIEIRTT